MAWAGVLAMSNTTVRNNRVVALESGFGRAVLVLANATSTVDRTWISNSVQAAITIGGGLHGRRYKRNDSRHQQHHQ